MFRAFLNYGEGLLGSHFNLPVRTHFEETKKMPPAKHRCGALRREGPQIEMQDGFIYIHEFSRKSQTEAV